jgi:poly(3-hydroxybutyrate) depolymerase
MKLCTLMLCALLISLAPSAVSAQQITKELIRSKGKDRVYYLFVPDKASPAAPLPMIVLLHGSSRNGNSLVEKWKDLAKKEGIILAGPDSQDSRSWGMTEDGPDFIYEFVEMLKAKYPINPRRVYLFGHSAGAVQALYLSLLESEYFAATAVHAGAMGAEADPFLDRARRKIPISIFVGTNDEFFPLSVVRATRDALNDQGFKCELTEIKDHTHWYYDRAAEINRSAWQFLKGQLLSEEPKYQKHQFK